MVRRSVVGLALASHPGPTAVVTALAAALTLGAGAGARVAVLVTAAVLSGQLSVGWSNDWVDADRDLTVGRSAKPVVAGLVTARGLRAAATGAAVACLALSFATGLVPGLVHVAAVASAWAYNLALKSSVWSWAPYAVSFALLPAFCVLAVAGEPRPAPWVLAAGALLGVGAHLANVLPDLDDDAATGVVGLPHRLGPRGVAVLAPGLLLGGVVVAYAGTEGGGAAGVLAPAAVVVALGAGLVGLLRPRSRLPFGLTMVVAGLCAGVLATAGPALVAGA